MIPQATTSAATGRHQTQTTPRQSVRLLLINPRSPDSFWSFRWAMDNIVLDQRATNPPLGLATLAGLCPAHWSIRIIDEAIEPLPEWPDADIVGVCGMGVQHPRQREVLAYYRQQGYFTVAGGSFASLCPERLEGLADCVVAGEAEYIWPRFCADYEAARVQTKYVETGSVDLSDVPTPRFDLLDLKRYGTATLQFSRGCPYRCEFCDIIVMFGRKPRTKTPQQIGRELDALRAQGARSAFFVDDNLIGNRKAARELLRYLVDYQKRNGYPFEFGTEASLNLADDEELLELFRDAGFAWVFLGIETPDVESLKAAGKTQNTRNDLLGAVRAIYAHGIDVYSGFIVGFDGDTELAFDRQYRFIVDAGIQVAMVGLLTALPRTPLYERLEREGRLRHDVMPGDNTRAQTNVLPAGMSYEALIAGYKRLYRRLFSDQGIARRIVNKTGYLRQPVSAGPRNSRPVQWQLLGRTLLRGVGPGGPRRWVRFASTLACPPRLWPLVVADWVRGLSMRAYADRYFTEAPAKAWASVARARRHLRRRFGPAFDRGDLSVAVNRLDKSPNLVLTLAGNVDERFFRAARRQLTRMLRQPRVALTIRIEHVSQRQRAAVIRTLERLGRFGQQVCVELGEQARAQLPLDHLRFRAILTPSSHGP
ncbi:MAG TPA: radical SAM protein [Xanthomonadales bacterium]|nr:radical SAM protein [Xanthomonadales bacterium]